MFFLQFLHILHFEYIIRIVVFELSHQVPSQFCIFLYFLYFFVFFVFLHFFLTFLHLFVLLHFFALFCIFSLLLHFAQKHAKQCTIRIVAVNAHPKPYLKLFFVHFLKSVNVDVECDFFLELLECECSPQIVSHVCTFSIFSLLSTTCVDMMNMCARGRVAN